MSKIKTLILKTHAQTKAELLNLPEVLQDPQLFQQLLYMTDQEFDGLKQQLQARQQTSREYHQERYMTIKLLQEIKQLLQEIKTLLQERR